VEAVPIHSELVHCIARMGPGQNAKRDRSNCMTK
jgi:hypothetical protein